MEFNKQQKEIINHIDGAMGVIAGAGSGKSTTLVERVNNMISCGVNPFDILIVTFTDNSSKDLKNKLNKKGISNITVGTFHSVCKRILVKEGYNTDVQLKSYDIKNIFKNIEDKITDAKTKNIMNFIDYQKNYGIGVDDDFLPKDSDYSEYELRSFYRMYEKEKSKKGILDFQDWLLMARDILKDKNKQKEYSYKYILVDEHQDSNLIQNDLIKLLCPSGNVFCVFDYRQAIYTFRGGNPEYCMNFKKYYPNAKIVNLDINYRSCDNIVENANKFIRNYYSDYEFYSDSIANNKNKGLIKKITSSSRSEEASKIIEMIKEDLSNGIKPNDIAVLYRNNSNSFELESELKYNNIPYFTSCKEGNFFNRKEISAIMCVLRLIDNPNDNDAYEKIFNYRFYPFTYLNNQVRDNISLLSANKNISLFEASEIVKTQKPFQRKNLDIFRNTILNLISQVKRNVSLLDIINNIIKAFRIEEFIELNFTDTEQEDRLQALESLKTFIRDNTLKSFLKFVYGSNKSQKKCTKNDIKLMTIHASKGLEFKKVYLIGIEDGKFPNEKPPIDEEARLMYVAITRPKEDLIISQIYEDNKFVEEYFSKDNE